MAILWFCDRCGNQVRKDSYGAGKYGIQVSFVENETDEFGAQVNFVSGKRFMKFCDQCAMEVEKFLDDEFGNKPETVTGRLPKEDYR